MPTLQSPARTVRLRPAACGLVGAGLMALALLTPPLPADAASCTVVGDRQAVIDTPDGRRSPMFLASACERLRLVSGRALASWVDAAGKPHLSPITAKGPGDVPVAAADEQAGQSAWAQLSSRREVQHAAFVRGARPDPWRTYLPPEGLALPLPPGVPVDVTVQHEGRSQPLSGLVRSADGQLLLRRDQIPAGARVFVSWPAQDEGGDAKAHRDTLEGPLWLETLADAETQTLDTERQHVGQVLADPAQRLMLDNMLYARHELVFNQRLNAAAVMAGVLAPAARP